MSCHIVHRNEIAYLLCAAMSQEIRGYSSSFDWYHDGIRHELPAHDFNRATEIGQMLWDANHDSVTSHYGDEGFDREIYERHIALYRSFDPVQIIKACHYFTYQSCEHEGWESSSACEFVKQLVHDATKCLPGYEAAKWGAPEPNNPFVKNPKTA